MKMFAAAASAVLSLGTIGVASAATAAPLSDSLRSHSAHSAVRSGPAVKAINRVSCGNRTDWLRVFSDATTCWASAGTTYVHLYNVYEWCPGNNNGYLVTSAGIQNFKKNVCGVLPAGKTVTVTQITIYN